MAEPRPPIRNPELVIAHGKRGTEPLTVQDASDDAAVFMLRREYFDLPVVARFTIDGEPASKARPRFSGYGSSTKAYTPEKTKLAEQVVGWKFRAAARDHRLDPGAAFGVMALFFCATRQRRDVDNMLKLILDGLNGIAWPDDSQVTEVGARKTLVLPEDARTEILVYRVGQVQRFTVKCDHCQRDFPVSPSWGNDEVRPRFCSRKCVGAARSARSMKTCPQCDTVFPNPHGRATFCSIACKSAAGRTTVICNRCGMEFTKQRCHVRKTNYCSTTCRDATSREHRQRNARGTCETCGGPTSKKTYRQCLGCKHAGTAVTGNPRVVAA